MTSLRKTFLALGLLSLVNVAPAAILYGDHFSVTYDEALTGPYKQGYLSGSLDTVYFQPNTYTVQSNGNLASNPAQLQLTLAIDPGYAFAGLSFSESGDYYLLRSGKVSVETSVTLYNPATTDFAELVLASSGLDQTRLTTSWGLAGVLSSQGLGAPQILQITLDNELFASAPTGGLGNIQKTYAGFQIMTRPAVIPEPSGLALLLAGIMAALLTGRRRSSIQGMRL